MCISPSVKIRDFASSLVRGSLDFFGGGLVFVAVFAFSPRGFHANRPLCFWEDWGEDGGIGYDNMHVEEVNGNKVTLVYRFAGLTADSVTVEINNNIGVFDTVFMGEDGGRGIIRFDDDKIYLEVHSPDNGESDMLNRDFSHQRSYSLYD